MYNCTGLPDIIKEPVAIPVGIEQVNCCKVKRTDALTTWFPINVLLPVDANDAVLAFVTYELVTDVSDAISVAKDHELANLTQLPPWAKYAEPVAWTWANIPWYWVADGKSVKSLYKNLNLLEAALESKVPDIIWLALKVLLPVEARDAVKVFNADTAVATWASVA